MERIIFSLTTEDFVTPEADGVIKSIAGILSAHGIRGSFALVGDKARALRTRGRKDVIAALRQHDIQYHANTHMMWPVTTLELSRMKWDEGVDLVMNTERHGIEDIAEIFGSRPVAYVNCGANWDPRELYGMNLLGIKGQIGSSHPSMPDGKPAWYVNVLNYRFGFSIERYFRRALTVENMRQEFQALTSKLAGTGVPIVAFAHSCMFATSRFYDLHNQSRRGVFPAKCEWQPAPALPRAEVRRRLAVFEEFVHFVAAQRDVKAVTHADVIAAHDEGNRWLTRGEVIRLAEAVRKDFNYQKVGAGYLSAADIFGVLSFALSWWTAHRAVPSRLPVRRLIGPPEPARNIVTPFRTTVSAVGAACVPVEREIDVAHRMPGAVAVTGRKVAPSSFLMAMADALLLLAAGKRASVSVTRQPVFPRCKMERFEQVKVGSSELPEDFQPGRIVTYTHLQTWTARPAVMSQA